MKPTSTVALLSAAFAIAFFSGCASQNCCEMGCCSSDSTRRFGTAPDGAPVSIYTLRNKNRVEARILNYGGIIQSLKVPDKAGHLGDVVLGFDQFNGYLTNSPYFGAMIGRYGNRIAKGHFT